MSHMHETSISPAGARWGLRWLLLTLAALAVMAVTASLGFWQLRRAAEKEQWQAQMDARAALPALDGRSLAVGGSSGDAAALLHRRVVVQGEWLPGHTVFLDNRQMQGKAGFYVLTPFRLSAPHENLVVVVQRGWAPRNFMDRAQLPEVQTPQGMVSIEGKLEAPPSKLMELELEMAGRGGADPDGQKSRIRQNADIAQWAQQSGLPLLALSVVQTGVASEGLLRDWPQINAGVQKHYGYAFQWFGLSVLVVLLYVWFQLVRRFYLPPRATASAAQQP